MDISMMKKTMLALAVVGFTASPAVLAGEGYNHDKKDRDATSMQHDATTNQDGTSMQRNTTTNQDGMGAAGTEGTTGTGTGTTTDLNATDLQDREDTSQPYADPVDQSEDNVDLDTEDRY